MPREATVKIRPALGAGVLVLALATSAQPAPAKPAKARIDALLRDAVADRGVKAAIVQVTAGGRRVMTRAYGESQDGEPATPRMRFRNGTVATAHMATLLPRLADRGRVDLDDKVAEWLPGLPGGRRSPREPRIRNLQRDRHHDARLLGAQRQHLDLVHHGFHRRCLLRRRDAEEWAIEVERSIDRGIHLRSITRATSHNAEFRPPNNHPMISESQNRRKSAPDIPVRKS